LPTITWFHTTPLICTVGNAAAETVSGSGAAGAVSAAAGALPNETVTSARFALISTNAIAPASQFALCRSLPAPRPRVPDFVARVPRAQPIRATMLTPASALSRRRHMTPHRVDARIMAPGASRTKAETSTYRRTGVRQSRAEVA
jgi:hypothetical protein